MLCAEARCPGEMTCVTTKFREGEDDRKYPYAPFEFIVKYPRAALKFVVVNAPGPPRTEEERLRDGLRYMFPESRSRN
ncbi:MAG: hypothetical protein Q8Q36_00730 [bacterium]|nr:hypothetical protein [bacterium]